jgi:hypothetical protein
MVSVSAKKAKKKFHACVPLIQDYGSPDLASEENYYGSLALLVRKENLYYHQKRF